MSPETSTYVPCDFPRGLEWLRAGMHVATLVALILAWQWGYWSAHKEATYTTMTLSGVAVTTSAYRLIRHCRAMLASNILEAGVLVGFMFLWMLWPARWWCFFQPDPTYQCFTTVRSSHTNSKKKY